MRVKLVKRGSNPKSFSFDIFSGKNILCILWLFGPHDCHGRGMAAYYSIDCMNLSTSQECLPGTMKEMYSIYAEEALAAIKSVANRTLDCLLSKGGLRLSDDNRLGADIVSADGLRKVAYLRLGLPEPHACYGLGSTWLDLEIEPEASDEERKRVLEAFDKQWKRVLRRFPRKYARAFSRRMRKVSRRKGNGKYNKQKHLRGNRRQGSL